jgi:hypothetical protein
MSYRGRCPRLLAISPAGWRHGVVGCWVASVPVPVARLCRSAVLEVGAWLVYVHPSTPEGPEPVAW